MRLFSSFRQSQEMPKANLIWRYKRFNTIFDYHGRSSWPFPFNILGNLYLILLYFTTKPEDRGFVSTTLVIETPDFNHNRVPRLLRTVCWRIPFGFRLGVIWNPQTKQTRSYFGKQKLLNSSPLKKNKNRQRPYRLNKPSCMFC